jgi:hypothetical protein
MLGKTGKLFDLQGAAGHLAFRLATALPPEMSNDDGG